jgi:hypothetical protein
MRDFLYRESLRPTTWKGPKMLEITRNYDGTYLVNPGGTPVKAFTYHIEAEPPWWSWIRWGGQADVELRPDKESAKVLGTNAMDLDLDADQLDALLRFLDPPA